MERVIHFRPGKTIIILLALSVFCFCMAPAGSWAENWTYFDTDKSGKWYYDKDGVAETGAGTVIFWTKVIYTKEGLRELLDAEKAKDTYNKGRESLNYSTFNYACNCEKLVCGLQGSIDYNARGNVVNTDYSSPVTQKWEKPRAGSYLEKVLTIVCKVKQ